MKVLVDGNETRQINADAESVAAVYRETITALAADGRSVVKVLADSSELSNEQQARMLKGDALPQEILAFESEDTKELAGRALAEVETHLGPLRRALSAASEALGRDDRTSAFEALRPALEVWLATVQAVHQVVTLTHIDTDAGDGAEFMRIHERTVDVFGHVQSTFQQEDWVRLNDLLEYELLPLADEWESLVLTLLNTLGPNSRA